MRNFTPSPRSSRLGRIGRAWLALVERLFCRGGHDWRTVRWRGGVIYGACRFCGRRGRV